MMGSKRKRKSKNKRREITASSSSDTSVNSIDSSSFDNKFDMIASNLKLLDSEIKAITGFVEALEQANNNRKTIQIVIGSISFVFIFALIGISGYLCRKTTVSQCQRRMNNMLRVVRNMRDEYQCKHIFQKARGDLNNLGQKDAEVK